MLLSDVAPIAFRSDSTDQLVRGRDSVLRLRPARGAAVTPTACTVTVTDAAGDVIVAAGGCSLSMSGLATFTVAAALTADLPAGDGWRVTWLVTLPGETVPREVQTTAALVLNQLYPVISDEDLFRRVSLLNPAHSACIVTIVDYSPYLDDAWALIHARLVGEGRRPWLIISPDALREAHLCLTLALVFEDLAVGTELNAVFDKKGKEFRTQYGEAWSHIDMVEAATATTSSSGSSARRGATAPTFLGGQR